MPKHEERSARAVTTVETRLEPVLDVLRPSAHWSGQTLGSLGGSVNESLRARITSGSSPLLWA
jgi:hypothetical protein